MSKEAVVQLAKSLHGEMRCRGFSSSLLGLANARQTSSGAMVQYAKSMLPDRMADLVL